MVAIAAVIIVKTFYNCLQGQYNLAANIDAKELSWAATNYLLYHANDCLLPSWSLFQNRLWNIVDVSQVNGVFSATIYFLPEGMTSEF